MGRGLGRIAHRTFLRLWRMGALVGVEHVQCAPLGVNMFLMDNMIQIPMNPCMILIAMQDAQLTHRVLTSQLILFILDTGETPTAAPGRVTQVIT